ncbi:MAG TPA: dihydrofolate reductase family protein [Pyrinomonadaceae bacterium]|nr:dihydrofolate reductase family protein [Pyrinomonadaceae bacterium]
MRKTIFGGANSLDNYIARPDGSYDWLMFSDEVSEIMKDFWPNIDAIVMGRKTWDVAQANMPKSKKKREAVLPNGEMKTYVFSRTLAAGETDDGAIIVNDDPGEFVRELKKREGKDICIMGGGLLARDLFEADVIDEIGFNIHPVLLGAGIPLFYGMSKQIDLELLESRQFKNGCVYVRYQVKN